MTTQDFLELIKTLGSIVGTVVAVIFSVQRAFKTAVKDSEGRIQGWLKKVEARLDKHIDDDHVHVDLTMKRQLENRLGVRENGKL